MTPPRLHLARDGRSLGQRASDEVAAALVADELRLTDLSWREGEPGWLPLGRRPEFAAATAFRVVPAPALERWRSAGLVRSAAATLRETLLAPADTFARLPAAGPIWPAFLLHLLLACLANALALVWAEWLIRPIWEALFPRGMMPWGQAFRFFGWVALATPVLVIVGAWLAPTLLQLALRLVGGGRGGWSVTFRAVNYVGAAANLVLAVPFLGMLATPWGAYCMVSALAASHRDPVWRPLLAMGLVALLASCVLVAAACLALMPFFAQLGG